MRKILMLVLIVALVVPCSGEDPQGSYPIWFDSFLTRFKACQFTMDERDKTDLADLLRFKPGGLTGPYYDDWFSNGFCWFLLESQSTITPEEAEKMEVMLKAMPASDGSGPRFGVYFLFVLKQLEGFLPTLSKDETLQLTFLKRAKPSSGTKDYQLWLQTYNQWKADFGPEYSPSEQEVLTFLEQIRPTGTSSEDTFLQVPRESLLRIKYLLQDNKPASAMEEIDKILQAGQ